MSTQLDSGRARSRLRLILKRPNLSSSSYFLFSLLSQSSNIWNQKNERKRKGRLCTFCNEESLCVSVCVGYHTGILMKKQRTIHVRNSSGKNLLCKKMRRGDLCLYKIIWSFQLLDWPYEGMKSFFFHFLT